MAENRVLYYQDQHNAARHGVTVDAMQTYGIDYPNFKILDRNPRFFDVTEQYCIAVYVEMALYPDIVNQYRAVGVAIHDITPFVTPEEQSDASDTGRDDRGDVEQHVPERRGRGRPRKSDAAGSEVE